MRKTLIICDIDGVLADCSHRLHYLEEKNYEAFYGLALTNDTLIEEGRRLLESLSWHDTVFLTGRPERTRGATEIWLNANTYMTHQGLLMRKDGDYRPSPTVKVELIKKHLKKKLKDYDIVYFIDDDPENIKAVCKTFPKITGITFGVGRMS